MSSQSNCLAQTDTTVSVAEDIRTLVTHHTSHSGVLDVTQSNVVLHVFIVTSQECILNNFSFMYLS